MFAEALTLFTEELTLSTEALTLKFNAHNSCCFAAIWLLSSTYRRVVVMTIRGWLCTGGASGAAGRGTYTDGPAQIAAVEAGGALQLCALSLGGCAYTGTVVVMGVISGQAARGAADIPRWVRSARSSAIVRRTSSRSRAAAATSAAYCTSRSRISLRSCFIVSLASVGDVSREFSEALSQSRRPERRDEGILTRCVDRYFNPARRTKQCTRQDVRVSRNVNYYPDSTRRRVH